MPMGFSAARSWAAGRKKFDLIANQGGPESCAWCAVRPSRCQGSTRAGAGLAFFLKARSIRGNITIKQTTAMEAASRIRNVVTIRSPSISSQLICPKRCMGVAKRRPPSSPKCLAHFSSARGFSPALGYQGFAGGVRAAAAVGVRSQNPDETRRGSFRRRQSVKIVEASCAHRILERARTFSDLPVE